MLRRLRGFYSSATSDSYVAHVEDVRVSAAVLKSRRRKDEFHDISVDDVPNLYFYSSQTASVLAALASCSDVESEEELLSDIDLLRRRVQIELASVVVSNYHAFLSGMQLVRSTELDLAWASHICTDSRRELVALRASSILNPLQTIRDHRTYTRALDLLKLVAFIRDIVDNETSYILASASGDFCVAVSHLQFCIEAIMKHPILKSIRSLNDVLIRLEGAHARLELMILRTIIGICRMETFDQQVYELSLEAYCALNRNPTDFASTIDVEFRSAFHREIELACIECVDADFIPNFDPEGGTEQFILACMTVPPSEFIHLFMKVVRRVGIALHHYQRICSGLLEFMTIVHSDDNHYTTTEQCAIERLCTTAWSNRPTVWEHIQELIRIFLSSQKLCTSNTVEVLQVLMLGHRLMVVGDWFASESHISNHKGENLSMDLDAVCARQRLGVPLQLKCQEYYDNFSEISFNSIKAQIENDNWHPLPVSSSFKIDSITELAEVSRVPQRYSLPQSTLLSPSLTKRNSCGAVEVSTTAELDASRDDDSDSSRLYSRFIKGVNVFSPQEIEMQIKVQSRNSSELVHSTYDADDYLSLDFPPVLTSSSMCLTRNVGNYVRTIRALAPIQKHAFTGLLELFEVYLYSVFSAFGLYTHSFFTDNKSVVKFKYPRLHKIVNETRAKVHLGKFGSGVFSCEQTPSPDIVPRVGPPPLVAISETTSEELDSEASMYGVINRCTAVESLNFLVAVYNWILPRTSPYLETELQVQLDRFVYNMKGTVEEFSIYMYRNLATRVLPLKQFSDVLIPNVNWRINEITDSHCTYVTTFVDLFREFATRLEGLTKGSGLPVHVYASLWEETLTYGFECLVDGYAQVKKCSTEGRAQMSADIRVLCSQILPLSPFPYDCIVMLLFTNPTLGKFYLGLLWFLSSLQHIILLRRTYWSG